MKEEAREFVKEFCKDPTGFILLSGKNGTGKTFLARQAYNACTPHRLPYRDDDLAIFTNQAELNMKWIEEIKDKGDAVGMLRRYCNTRLLVLDDLGTRIPSEAFMDFLYAIADARYNEARGTIITTNLTAKALREKFGDAFASRVASGRCFRFEGSDRRFRMPQDCQKGIKNELSLEKGVEIALRQENA